MADNLLGISSFGLDLPHMSFMLPDGQTSNGWETYTCVQNPNPASVTVRVTYLLEGEGTLVSFTDEIPKNSRKTYDMVPTRSYPEAPPCWSSPRTGPVP